jgi:phage terminase small subunit
MALPRRQSYVHHDLNSGSGMGERVRQIASVPNSTCKVAEAKWEEIPVLNNIRHERFAQELARGKTARQAYVDAGYKDTRAAESSASDLLRNPKVIARITEIQERAAKCAEVKIETLIREAEQVRCDAMSKGQLSAANRAIELKARLAGHWVDRSQVSESISPEFKTKEELKAWLIGEFGQELARQIWTKWEADNKTPHETEAYCIVGPS